MPVACEHVDNKLNHFIRFDKPWIISREYRILSRLTEIKNINILIKTMAGTYRTTQFFNSKFKIPD